MNTWTPLFSKIVDSSLWCEPDHVCKVFITMLALKDADHVVRYNAFGLGRRCWPSDPKAETRVVDALKVLSSPDKSRLEPQPFDGRRIEKVEDGWLILNGQSYREMMQKVNRRQYKAEKQKEYRLKSKSNPMKKSCGSGPLKGEVAAVKAYEKGDMDEFDRISALRETPPAYDTKATGVSAIPPEPALAGA